MLGNAWEWTWDFYGLTPDANPYDPTGPVSGTGRTHRGGGWTSQALLMRSAYRSIGLWPYEAYYDTGLRAVRTLPALVCDPEHTNVCGGCNAFTHGNAPGQPCGPGQVWVCETPETVLCEVFDSY